MIVISRNVNEALVIGDAVTVKIAGLIRDKTVLLGISAPPGTMVCKEEHLVAPDAVVQAEKPREENP